MSDDLALLQMMDLSSAIEAGKKISANTADKAYRKLTSHSNVTSYSLLTELHACPRRFEVEKYQANMPAFEVGDNDEAPNLDFAFGHSVGAGVQTYAATGSLVAAQFAGFTAWRAPWDAVKVNKKGVPSGKSITDAMIAIEKFKHTWDHGFEDWEVAVLPSGKLAVELAFAVDFENGFWYFGHIDMVLKNKEFGHLGIYEGKTTGFSPNPASWGNSNQALGYGVVVDHVSKLLGLPEADYDVLYNIYSTSQQEFTVIPFHKDRSSRAAWLQDILLDHANISTYQKIGFFPKRGESCVNQWGRECFWYGQCQMSNESLFPGVTPQKLVTAEDVEALDFVFKLSDLIKTQKEKA